MKVEKHLKWLALWSGACLLVYQGVWLRLFGLIFGGTSQAAGLVLAAFMGGLALGSWLAKRRPVRDALRTYACLEALTGLLALAGLFCLHVLPNAYGNFAATQSLGPSGSLLIKACLAALLILPPCVSAGMTLPLLSEAILRRGASFRASFAGLYAFNTLGALLGLGASMTLLPRVGISATLVVAVAANFLLALIAWSASPSGEPTAALAPRAAPGPSPQAGMLGLVALGSGVFSFALELVWMRTFAPVLGSSVYALNLVIAAVLVGYLLGTLCYQRLAPRLTDAPKALGYALLALGLLTLLSLPLAGRLPQAYLFLVGPLKVSLGSYQTAGLALSLLFLLPSTLLQGFCFPLFSHLRPAGTLPAQSATGELYAWNTAGAMLGALLAGFWMLNALGLQASYSVLAWIPLALGVALASGARGFSRSRQAALQAGALALCLSLAYFFRPWNPQLMTSAPFLLALHPENGPQGGESLAAHQARVAEPLFYRDGKEVLVGVKASGGDHILTVNGKPEASNGWDFSTQKSLAHLTLLLHPAPKSALVIGWGAGSSAASAGLHPLERLDCVEIEPAVFEARGLFREVNFAVAEDPRFHIHFGDGRNFLLESPRRYDAIISQPSNPWIQGVANLFTLDFYATVSAHLEKGGIFGQWFQYYNMSPEDLKTLLRTFDRAFKHTSLWAMPDRVASKQLAGDLLLLGSQEPMPLDGAGLERKIQGASAPLRQDLERAGLNGTYPVLSHYWLGKEELLQVAGEGPVFQDDLPALEFSAAKNLYLSPQASQDQIWGNFSMLKAAVQYLLPPVGAWPPLAPGAPKKVRAEALRQLAAGYIQDHLYERAQSLLQDALLLDAGSAETWMLFAKINYARPGHAGSDEAARKAVALDPGRGDVWMLLGSLDYEAQDWKGGRDAYARASKLRPTDAQAWSGLALCLARMDDWKNAEIAVKRSLVIDAHDPMATALLAKVRSVMGKN